jgi:hypothetical protein
MLIEARRLLLGSKFSAAIRKLYDNDFAHVTSDKNRTRERTQQITKSFSEKVSAARAIKGIEINGLLAEIGSIKIRPRTVDTHVFLVIEVSGNKFFFEETNVESNNEKKLVFIDVEWSTD